MNSSSGLRRKDDPKQKNIINAKNFYYGKMISWPLPMTYIIDVKLILFACVTFAIRFDQPGTKQRVENFVVFLSSKKKKKKKKQKWQHRINFYIQLISQKTKRIFEKF